MRPTQHRHPCAASSSLSFRAAGLVVLFFSGVFVQLLFICPVTVLADEVHVEQQRVLDASCRDHPGIPPPPHRNWNELYKDVVAFNQTYLFDGGGAGGKKPPGTSAADEQPVSSLRELNRFVLSREDIFHGFPSVAAAKRFNLTRHRKAEHDGEKSLHEQKDSDVDMNTSTTSSTRVLHPNVFPGTYTYWESRFLPLYELAETISCVFARLCVRLIMAILRRDRAEVEGVLQRLKDDVVWNEITFSPWPVMHLLYKAQVATATLRSPREPRLLTLATERATRKGAGKVLADAAAEGGGGDGERSDQEPDKISGTDRRNTEELVAGAALSFHDSPVVVEEAAADSPSVTSSISTAEAVDEDLESFETVLSSRRSLAGLIATKVDNCFAVSGQSWLRRESDFGSYAAKFRDIFPPIGGADTDRQATNSETRSGRSSSSFYAGLASDFLLSVHSWFTSETTSKDEPSKAKARTMPFPFFDTHQFFRRLVGDFCLEYLYTYALIQMAMHVEFTNVTPGFVLRWVQRLLHYPNLAGVDGLFSNTDNVALHKDDELLLPWEGEEDEEDVISAIGSATSGNAKFFRMLAAVSNAAGKKDDSNSTASSSSTAAATESTSGRVEYVKYGVKHALPCMRRTRSTGNTGASGRRSTSPGDASSGSVADDEKYFEDEFFFALRRYVAGAYGSSLGYFYSVELHYWLAKLTEKEFRMKLGGVDVAAYFDAPNRVVVDSLGAEQDQDQLTSAEQVVVSSGTTPTSKSTTSNSTVLTRLEVEQDDAQSGEKDEQMVEVVQEEQFSDQERSALQKLLKGIHDLCEAFGLPYVLAQGTLLGSMRHHGLIPWTGDAEIGVDYSYMPFFFVLALLQSSHFARLSFLHAELQLYLLGGERQAQEDHTRTPPEDERFRNSLVVYKAYYKQLLEAGAAAVPGNKKFYSRTPAGTTPLSTAKTESQSQFLAQRYRLASIRGPAARRLIMNDRENRAKNYDSDNPKNGVGNGAASTEQAPAAVLVLPKKSNFEWFAGARGRLQKAFDIFHARHQVFSLFVSRPFAPKFFYKDLLVELEELETSRNMHAADPSKQKPATSTESRNAVADEQDGAATISLPSFPDRVDLSTATVNQLIREKSANTEQHQLSTDVSGFYHRYPYLDVMPTYFHEATAVVGYTSFMWGYRFPFTWVYPRKTVFVENVGPMWAWSRSFRVLRVKYDRGAMNLNSDPMKTCVGHHLSHKTMVSTGDVLPKKMNCSDVPGLPVAVPFASPVAARTEMANVLRGRATTDHLAFLDRVLAVVKMDRPAVKAIGWLFSRCDTLRTRQRAGQRATSTKDDGGEVSASVGGTGQKATDFLIHYQLCFFDLVGFRTTSTRIANQDEVPGPAHQTESGLQKMLTPTPLSVEQVASSNCTSSCAGQQNSLEVRFGRVAQDAPYFVTNLDLLRAHQTLLADDGEDAGLGEDAAINAEESASRIAELSTSLHEASDQVTCILRHDVDADDLDVAARATEDHDGRRKRQRVLGPQRTAVHHCTHDFLFHRRKISRITSSTAVPEWTAPGSGGGENAGSLHGSRRTAVH
ncbi:unnamed protein product [Amoebophrya sp. A120]|nr:unnamed protein product [Amoebophrya sp. A120]|eukprot:GSA120T00001461001.1